MQQSSDPARGLLVTVGIPVYNGGATLAAAIESVLSQSYSHLEVIISDNCSTDGTEATCREFARRDARVRYIRQKANIGAVANFLFVLEEARGPLFMWAAADDHRSTDFIEINAAYLSANPEYVGATSPVRFENDVPDSLRMGDYSLDQDLAEERTLNFFIRWHANGRFYSLFRRDALLKVQAFRHSAYLAADWAYMLEMAQLGKFHRSELGETVLGVKGESSDPEMLRKVRRKRIEYFVPFWEFGGRVWQISKDFSLTGRLKLCLILINLNLRCLVERLRRRYRRFRRK